MKMTALRVTLFLMLAATGPLQAGMMEPMSVETIATNADVIVHGKVVGKTVQRDSAGRIYTRVQLEITEVWKGEVRPGFSIVHGGGRLGNEEARASIQVNYEVGEEIVAMLRLNHRGEGVTVGLIQGKFHIATEPATGLKYASNVFHGRSEAGSREPAPPPTVQSPLTVDELKRRVKTGGAQ